MLPIPFGNPQTYTGHSGVDYPQPRGTVVHASGHGYVRNIGKNARGGNYVWVVYDGYPAVGYHHIDSRGDILVSAGQEIWEGTPLSRVGSLGLLSTGPHLHSEVEGYGTSSGYWLFFDRNRVVGQGNPSGGGSTTPEDDDMALNIDDKNWLMLTVRYEVRRALGLDLDSEDNYFLAMTREWDVRTGQDRAWERTMVQQELDRKIP